MGQALGKRKKDPHTNPNTPTPKKKKEEKKKKKKNTTQKKKNPTKKKQKNQKKATIQAAGKKQKWISRRWIRGNAGIHSDCAW